MMIPFFKKLRKKMADDNKPIRYIRYAIGEIVLVVIGILIALQVNNWNIERTDKLREAKYLANIVLDLKKDISRLDYLIEFRKKRISGDQKIIDLINGKSLANLTELTENVVNSLMEENFVPNNTTFSELSNSGNLNLISNDSIKLLLLELEELYKVNRLSIEHETNDYREYISKPAIHSLTIDQLFPVYLGTKTIEEQKITFNHFNTLLKSNAYKNGLFIMSFMSQYYITAYEAIKAKSETIIRLIELDK